VSSERHHKHKHMRCGHGPERFDLIWSSVDRWVSDQACRRDALIMLVSVLAFAVVIVWLLRDHLAEIQICWQCGRY
jgi:hypothetical protein